MRALLEVTAAGGIAVGVHVLALSLLATSIGSQEAGAGAGGGDVISIAAAPQALAALIAQWDNAPEALASLREQEPPASAPPQALSVPISSDALLAAVRPQPLALPMPADPATTPLIEPAPPPERLAPAAPRDPVDIRPAARPPSLAQAAQEAQGRGTGEGSGQAAGAGLGAQAQSASLSASWHASIRARIERQKSYPQAAAGASGTVTLFLEVQPDGALAQLLVQRTSGNPELDASALAAVRRAAPFPPAPAAISAQKAVLVLPMSFSR